MVLLACFAVLTICTVVVVLKMLFLAKSINIDVPPTGTTSKPYHDVSRRHEKNNVSTNAPGGSELVAEPAPYKRGPACKTKPRRNSSHHHKEIGLSFTAIDFETANSSRDSACSIGLCRVEQGRIVQQEHHLIKPVGHAFADRNVAIHGIRDQTVKDEPDFRIIWGRVVGGLSPCVVAHNASFDMSVLRKSLDSSKLTYPSLRYYDSIHICKVAWPFLATYKLANMAAYLGISFEHHNAGEDAATCAKIVLKALDKIGVKRLEDLDKFGVRCGRLHKTGYTPGKYVNQTTGNREKPIPSGNQISGLGVCFTGTLTTYTREEAWDIVSAHGGVVHKSVRKDTNILVVGPGTSGTTKRRRAEALKDSGADIRILTESEFIALIEKGI